MLKRFTGAQGQVITLRHESQCLKGNRLGDPHERSFHVYLPAAYEQSPDRRFPVMFDLVGFTGSGFSHTNWRNFTENVPDRLDRLIHEGQMPPCIVAFPDCFTALGGNQYIDSSAIGDYATYLTEELIPFVDSELRTLADRKHRAVFGKSSGGYGSMIHAMKYTDYWGAAACHAGDAYFELCYLPEFPRTLNILAKHGHSIEAYLKHFHSLNKVNDDQLLAIMTICMAATYDPDPDAPLGFHMPCDLVTGEIDWQRFDRWRAHDPVNLVESCAENLKRLQLLYIDCGSKDQFHLHYGARILHQRLEKAGVEHIYEEFDDNHSAIDYRMDVSLPKLAEAIA